MTRDEFFSKLAEVKDKFNWQVSDAWGGAISGFLKDDDKKWNLFCPITAVSYVSYGALFQVSNYSRAGECIGLCRDDIIGIVDAADNRNPEILQSTRKSLLETLDLSEKAPQA